MVGLDSFFVFDDVGGLLSISGEVVEAYVPEVGKLGEGG